MNLFKRSAKDPHIVKEPLNFVEKENILLINQEIDIKNIFESSFVSGEVKKPFAVIETIDGSFHSILEVQPIKYNSLEPILQKEIQREYYNFFSNVDFPFGIVKRIVNSNSTTKVSSLLGRIEYKLKQRKSKDLLKSIKPISTFITNLSKKFNNNTRKYYIFVSFKPPIKTKKGIEERAKKVLGERIVFVMDSLKKAKLNSITPLVRNTAYNLFLSYIKDYMYDGSMYLTPTNWLQHFYHGSSSFTESVPVTADSNTMFPQVKEYIKRKGTARQEELMQFFSKLNADKTKKLRLLLEEDPEISCYEDIYEFVSLDKLTPDAKAMQKEFLVEQNRVVDQSYIRIGGTLNRIFIIPGMADYVKNDFLKPVIDSKEDVDLVMFFEPSSKIEMDKYYASQLNQIEKTIYSLSQKGYEDKSLIIRKEKILNEVEKLKNPKTNLFGFTAYFNVKASNEDELNSNTDRLLSVMKSSRTIIKVATNFQSSCYKSIVPTGLNYFGRHKTKITNELIAQNFPFVDE